MHSTGVNSLLAAIDRDNGVPGLHVDLSSKYSVMQFNNQFLNTGGCGTLKRKDYLAMDMDVSIIEAYIDRTRRFKIEPILTSVQCTCSDLVITVVSQNNGRGWFVAHLKICAETFVRLNTRR